MYHLRLEIAKKISDKTYNKYHMGAFYDPDEPISYLNRIKLQGLYRKTKVPCSCWRCGNPRKWFGERTRKEIEAEIDYREQLEEVF